jgi:hypothetical protein
VAEEDVGNGMVPRLPRVEANSGKDVLRAGVRNQKSRDYVKQFFDAFV